LKEKDLMAIPHLILGDFNSLSHKTDYTEEEWSLIETVRSRNKWEFPKTKVIETMENNYGYIDCWKAAGGKLNTPTCWANTRIDVRLN
jgi:hypothetical protein